MAGIELSEQCLLGNPEELLDLVHFAPGLHDNQGNEREDCVDLAKGVVELAPGEERVHLSEPLRQHLQRVRLRIHMKSYSAAAPMKTNLSEAKTAAHKEELHNKEVRSGEIHKRLFEGDLVVQWHE